MMTIENILRNGLLMVLIGACGHKPATETDSDGSTTDGAGATETGDAATGSGPDGSGTGPAQPNPSDPVPLPACVSDGPTGGRPSFARPVEFSPGTQLITTSAVIGAFDGDSALDLAVSSTGSVGGDVSTDTFIVVHVDWSMGFSSVAEPFSVGNGDATIVPSDLDGDGRYELLNHRFARYVASDGTVQEVVLPGSIPGDFDGDGVIDLAEVDGGEGVIRVHRGVGELQYAELATTPFGGWATSWIVGDFDGDGHLDVVVTRQDSQSEQNMLELMLGDGAGSFHNGTSVELVGPVEQLTRGDFDCDGRADLVLVGPNDALEVREWDDERFMVRATIEGQSPAHAAAGDVNGDGHHDLAVAFPGWQSQEHGITVYLGDGTGGLDAGLVELSAPEFPNYVEVADLDGNGHEDLVVTFSGMNDVYVWRSNVEGSTNLVPQRHTTARNPDPG